MPNVNYYLIQCVSSSRGQLFTQYLKIELDQSPLILVTDKMSATHFDSLVLARGWLIKIQSMFPTLKWEIVTS